MHSCFLASDLLTKYRYQVFLVTCCFQKFVAFLAIKVAAYEEFITPIYIYIYIHCPAQLNLEDIDGL